MSEPLPSLPAQAPPTNAEDRKAAAALSSLDAQHQSDEDNENGSKPSKQAINIDQEALGRAISRLELSSKEKQPRAEGVGKGKAVDGDIEEEAKKKVKIDQGDVLLLIEELELSKGKATDLLRAHEGDAVRAMKAFVAAPV